ncbi:MAG TPA: rhomboid family intramembrane serine protease [Bryobacteraceae bacterium]|nr:rhomboid family intramembrane serine protease [Bryobacteraceae bacterium]
MEKRRMCPNCRAFITVNDRVCPYCDVQLGPRAVDLRAAQLAAFLPRANSLSIIILTINFAIYAGMVVIDYQLSKTPSAFSFDGRLLVLCGAKFGPYIRIYGQWWRLITAGFLHGGIIHILMNSWALFDLVGEVEQFYGASRLIVAYILSTFTGFLLSNLWSPGVSIGSSAALFGMIGIMLSTGLRRDTPIAQSVRAYYKRWAIYGLIFSLVPFLNIDLAAHIGGLAGGFVLGLIAGLPTTPNSPKEILWNILAGLALLITIYSFVLEFMAYPTVLRMIYG